MLRTENVLEEAVMQVMPRKRESGTQDVVDRLVAKRRQHVADAVTPLRAEAQRVTAEIDELREAARRLVWMTIVQTREIHDRMCDLTGQLEHLQLDIRERTGEVRLPSVPTPFVDFLTSEIRRFVVTER